MGGKLTLMIVLKIRVIIDYVYGKPSYINNSYQQRALDVFYYYNNEMGKK